MRKAFFIILAVGFLFPLPSFGADFEVSSYNLRRGDTAVVYFKNPDLSVKSAEFESSPVSFFKYKNHSVAVFGIPATQKAGTYRLKIIFDNNEEFKKDFKVIVTGAAKKVSLGIPKELGVDAKGLIDNLAEQKKIMENVFNLKSDDLFFSKPFGLPLYDNRKISSIFNEIRVTGGTEIRHLGIDISAREGVKVAAINDGIVRKAYFDDTYGNSVIVDHGHGIFSAYFHMKEYIVKEGGYLKKGNVIGSVGKTGYATAPHLHLSIKINNVSVDPLKFVRAFK